MKKSAIILLVFNFVFTGCKFNSLPSGITNANTTVRTEARDVSGFKVVRVANNFDLELTVGAPFNVSVEGDDTLIAMVSTKVEEEELIVALDKKFSRSTKVAIKISMPELKELEMSGGSIARVTGVKGDAFRVQANGATRIKLSGEVKALDAHAYGASVIDAEGLKSTSAEVEALGATNVTVSPSATLNVVAKGMATVFYTGDPKIEKTLSNTSSVKKKE
jgi:Putative auto-transporter adhesin, head GIN domain